MSTLTARKRDALSARDFALPKLREYPIHDAAHVRAATARLEQAKATMPATHYREARKNILRAAKRFKVDSMYAHRAPRTARKARKRPRAKA